MPDTMGSASPGHAADMGGGSQTAVKTSDPLGLLDITYTCTPDSEISSDTATQQQGLGNAAIVARSAGEEASLTSTNEPPANDTDNAGDAISILGVSYPTDEALVPEVPANDSVGDKAASGADTAGAKDSGSGQGDAADTALATFEPADAGGGERGAGAQGDALSSTTTGGFDIAGLLPLPVLPKSGSPLPVYADNAAALTQIVQSNAQSLRKGIADSAQQAVLDAIGRGAKIAAAIDASALTAIAQVRADADSTMAAINTETTDRLGQMGEQHDSCAAIFDAMIDDALLVFEAAYVLEADNVAAAIEAKANDILAYGAARAAAVRASVQARIDKARELRDEAYAPYRTHEDGDDVWEAVSGACAEAVTRFETGAEETAKAIEAFARDAAATWRSEVPPNNVQLTAVWERSTTALEAERDKLKADLADKTALLASDLAQAVTDAGTEIEAAVTSFNISVEEARLIAQQDLTAALDSHTIAIGTAADDTTNELGMIEQAMLDEIGALKTESGGIFDPEDARPALERIFGSITAAWTSRATGAQADFTSASDGAAADFESRVATSATTASSSFTVEVEAFATTAETFMANVTLVQADAVALAQGQVDTVSAQVGIDLCDTALTITNALDAAYMTAVENIDQTEFKMTATHNGAVYRLRQVYQDAITEALKSWYEKLWDWLVDVIGTILGAIGDFIVWIGKTIVNILWGFIWGEAVFPEAWGAGAIVFIADIVAGVLVYGDVRDIFKWGFWKPVVMGEGYGWLNALMIGLALLGIIPLVGDIAKAFGKGAKALMKELGEKITRELLQEFAERGGMEVVERLVKDLGAEAVKELTEKLGAKGFRELVEGLGEKGLKELVSEIGAEATARLAKEFGAAGLKAAVDTFTARVLRDLAAELGEKTLKEAIDALTAATVKELVGVVGATGLKDLVGQFTLPGLKTLLDVATGITAKLAGELTQEFGAKAFKELVDAVGVPALRELTGVLTTKALKEMTTEFTPAGMRILLDAATGVTGRMAGELTKEFGPPAFKQLVDAVGVPALRELTGVLDAAAVKAMTDEFTVAGMRTLLDAATGLSGRAAGELVRDLGAKTLKELADELTMPVLRELSSATTGIGTHNLAELARGLSRRDIGKLLRKVKVGAVVQMVADMGADRLVRTINVAGYVAFARGVGLVRDPLAIAATAASYSAKALNETLDITRRFGANTATFHIGTSGAVESAEATLSHVGTLLKRSPAEDAAQSAVAPLAGDQGGHIIAHRFLSDQNRLNMFPQAEKLNHPVFSVLENEIAAWIGAGATVRMTVNLVGAAAGRPSAIQVTYRTFTAAGTPIFNQTVTFLNQAGQTFTRLTTSDIAARVAATTP
ncbi:DNA/RNA non-specific endonuclease [Sphingomonas sp. S1-29]|uniref:DNA/RNA non-specific endonuclease n=1 Tax=Sphingomonas sp. S1-29 TaxID=2991074 RepID=UPI00224028A7|nr:DNA/RNA non-specific endonuclease [Sphingomonas sp. S1-29]UZK70299.1 DNA/RNA non-specific endonuclease [Sphingomonas sp. S1-29]